MQKHTTSYNTRRPTPRRAPQSRGYQLPRGKSRSARRPGATYLNHTQGFGGNRRRRMNHDPRRRARRTYALIIVGCALLFFTASVIWYLNRSVPVTLNGEEAHIHINGTIQQLIENEGLDESCAPGDLLAVDDSVLEREGGARYSVTLDGEEVPEDALATTELTGGEVLEIADGADVYEEHTVDATVIEPTISLDGSGSIQYVRTWGVPGRSEVWHGAQSGITFDRGVVQEAVDCQVVRTSVSPDDNGRYVALTFDEGPSGYTQDILDVLEEKGVSATFFLQGDAVEEHPELARAIADAGHELGTNAYSDTNLTGLTGDDLRAEITRGFDAIEAATGSRPTLLRAPFGSFSTENWAESMDLMGAVVYWNVDSGDWELPGSDAIVENVMGSIRNGNIVLLTDSDATGEQLVAALPDLIDRLEDEGYKLVTVSELVETDSGLAEELDPSRVGLPEGAALPTTEKNEGDSEA